MDRRERSKCGAACATCPFRKENFGKPNPEGYDPRASEREHGDDFHDWYSEANLRRLWGGLSRGGAMLCHSSDPGAPIYGGKAVAPGGERLCAGALAIVLLHMKRVEQLVREADQAQKLAGRKRTSAETMRLYRRAAGKHPLTRQGVLLWAQMITIGTTELFGGLPLPQSLSAATVAACGVPWEDPIVAAAQTVASEIR